MNWVRDWLYPLFFFVGVFMDDVLMKLLKVGAVWIPEELFSKESALTIPSDLL
jgi:hypothetical protein